MKWEERRHSSQRQHENLRAFMVHFDAERPLLRRVRSLRSKAASVPKYRFKHLGHPTCLRKRRRFGLRHKPDFQHFLSIRALRTAHLFRFKHSHDIRSAISMAVVNDEFRSPEDADQTCEPNQEPSFFEHLADGGIGRNFSRLYCATWQEPNAAFRMTYHEHASLHIAQCDRHGRNLEQLVTSNQLAETPDVLSHRVKVLRLVGRDRAISHGLAQRRRPTS